MSGGNTENENKFIENIVKSVKKYAVSSAYKKGHGKPKKIRGRKTRNRRRQEVRRQLLLIGVVLILVIVSVASCVHRCSGKERSMETSGIKKETAGAQTSEVKSGKADTQQLETEENSGNNEAGTGKAEKQDVQTEESETEKERITRLKKEAKAKKYPSEIIKLLSKNPETADFVEHYGEKKDSAAAKTIGKVKKGEIPLLIQWDERWGYAPYGTSTVAASGCGPTCMAMVVAGLTGDNSVTPAKVAAYGTKNGYVNEDNDTNWNFMAEASQNWGVSSYETNSMEETVAEELKSGHPVICSVGPGDFTKNGHFIVLVGYEDGKVEVHDPFSKANSEKLWVYEDIADQIKAMWAYYK